MLIYRVQPYLYDFILRHPDHCVPEIHCKTQQEVIDKLPAFFARFKEPVQVQIINGDGYYERTLDFPVVKPAPVLKQENVT